MAKSWDTYLPLPGEGEEEMPLYVVRKGLVSMKGPNYTRKGLDNAGKGLRNNTSRKHLESVHSVGSGPDAPGRVYISLTLPHWRSRLRAQDMFCRGWVSRLVGASDVGLTGGGLMKIEPGRKTTRQRSTSRKGQCAASSEQPGELFIRFPPSPMAGHGKLDALYRQV